MSQFERNDNAARTLSPQDGQVSCAAVDGNGRLFTIPNAGEGTSAATFAAGTLAFGSVTTSFATLLTNSANALILQIDNLLDVDVWISFDASTNHMFVGAGNGKIVDLGAVGRHMASTISVKSIDSNASAGDIYASVVS